VAIIASTHPPGTFVRGVMPLLPGPNAWENYRTVIVEGRSRAGTPPIGGMLWNSFVMAMAITIGKLSISILSAFAIVYFRFPFRIFFFWIIFLTLMLPVEVRIVPTFQVVADLGMLNSPSPGSRSRSSPRPPRPSCSGSSS
jgi:sn-glycerol 3-phosphate transport system permease protein